MSGDLKRRLLLQGGAVMASGLWLPHTAAQSAAPRRGGTLVIAQHPEPSVLTTAITTSPPTQQISAKVFDGLVSLTPTNGPQPQLATAWTVSDDGLTVTFRLRPNVRWHDGKPFTSEDVAFSVMEVWKKYSSRGRSAFPHVERVDSPEALTSVWHLSKPTPYLLSALNARDSQVIPKHLYAGRGDVLANPANAAPVGTGPFRFVRWDRGNQIVLKRNDDYWDTGKPYLDQVIYRFIPDSAGVSAALETGSVQVASGDNVAVSEVARLRGVPSLQVHPRVPSYGGTGIMAFEFNLNRPVFRDLRVRQAFAHAIDRDTILRNVYRGLGTTADSPIPKNFPQFYSGDVPHYAFDLKRAEALLEAAGLKRNAQGVRLTVYNDPSPSPTYLQTAYLLRSHLARIGVRLEIRTQDFAEWLNRIYTRNDFDTNLSGASTAPDPAIGFQRFYWSKNRQPGVAYSNATQYANAEVDALLEAAQVELDPAKRHAQYVRLQQLVLTDLPRIPVISTETVVVASKQVRGLVESDTGGYLGNLAEVYFVGSAPSTPSGATAP
jgi:peptide/nickel transport system substrate-binding protein